MLIQLACCHDLLQSVILTHTPFMLQCSFTSLPHSTVKYELLNVHTLTVFHYSTFDLTVLFCLVLWPFWGYMPPLWRCSSCCFYLPFWFDIDPVTCWTVNSSLVLNAVELFFTTSCYTFTALNSIITRILYRLDTVCLQTTWNMRYLQRVHHSEQTQVGLFTVLLLLPICTSCVVLPSATAVVLWCLASDGRPHRSLLTMLYAGVRTHTSLSQQLLRRHSHSKLTWYEALRVTCQKVHFKHDKYL